jgi:hypothetical protein
VPQRSNHRLPALRSRASVAVRALFALCLAAPPLTIASCDAVPGFSLPGRRITTITGSLVALSGRQVRLMVLANGSPQLGSQEQVPGPGGAMEPGFVFDGLPAGPKAMVGAIDGVLVTLKFPKSAGAGAPFAAVIPETNVDSATLDLGVLSVGGALLTPETNPLAASVDTDDDGVFDFFDNDIDGDGLPNDADGSVYGPFEDYLGYGWADEATEPYDDDNDGLANWEDPDSGAGFDIGAAPSWTP